MSQSLALLLVKLTLKERIYVQGRLDGLTQIASASAAGVASPNAHATEWESRPQIQEAMLAAMQETAEEVGFTRKEAHEMLLSAYNNAATAAEQIAAVKEMVALHGLAAAKKIEVAHKHTGTVSLERMETAELMKLADMEDLILEGEFEVVDAKPRLSKL